MRSETQHRPLDSAGRVLGPERGRAGHGTGMQGATRRTGRHPPAPSSIAAAVLPPLRSRRGAALLGLVVAAAVHAGLAALAWNASGLTPDEPFPEEPSKPLTVAYDVELDRPEAESEPESEPEPEPEPEPPPRRAAKPSPQEPAAPQPHESPPPAQASEAVAAEAPSEPVDFASFDIAAGDAEHYAGGVTASNGTDARAVHTRNVDPTSRSRGRGRREHDLSRPAGPNAEWNRCPWPQEADALGIDEQIVELRAVIDADGNLVATHIVSDPGYGFGEKAIECAPQTGHHPARDGAGNPYPATSPTFTVRFTR